MVQLRIQRDFYTCISYGQVEKVEAVVAAVKEVDVELDADARLYPYLCRYQDVEQKHTDNKSFENLAKFNYFKTTVTNQHSENSCYFLFRIFCLFLSNNIED
jgi:hypothetical protein